MESDRVEAGAKVYVPTLSERALRALGFRWPGPVYTPEHLSWKGWSAVESTLHFSFLDRVRILFGGNVHLSYRILSLEAVTEMQAYCAVGIWPGRRP